MVVSVYCGGHMNHIRHDIEEISLKKIAIFGGACGSVNRFSFAFIIGIRNPFNKNIIMKVFSQVNTANRTDEI